MESHGIVMEFRFQIFVGTLIVHSRAVTIHYLCVLICIQVFHSQYGMYSNMRKFIGIKSYYYRLVAASTTTVLTVVFYD